MSVTESTITIRHDTGYIDSEGLLLHILRGKDMEAISARWGKPANELTQHQKDFAGLLAGEIVTEALQLSRLIVATSAGEAVRQTTDSPSIPQAAGEVT